jgi:membrane-bound serine protease (ClpP class)
MNTKLFTIAAVLLLQMFSAPAALKTDDRPANPASETAPPAPSPLLETPTGKTPQNAGGPVFVFPFKSEVSPASLTFLRRALKEAERAGASAFILDMDTPGGRLDVTIDIFELMHRTKVPTITFVNPHALSAGALVSLATKKIYMRPDATIGAAAVVSGDGQEIQKTMQLKIDSFMAAKMRAVCEENGHNPDIAEAFMVVTKELKVGDTLINSKDSLLSLNGREAAKLYDGKPLLATGLAESIEEVLKAEGLTGAITNVEATGFERIAFWITMLAPLLLMGGIIGAYIEMKAPGFGLPGIASLICFGLFFGGHLIAGLAGWESVILFVIGMLLIMFEIFGAPGTVIPGIVGTVLVLGSVVWAMVDQWPGQPGWPTGDSLERPLFNLVLGTAGAAVAAAILAKYLPKTSLYRRLVLSAASADGPAVTVPIVNLELKIGDVGVAATTLRPAGKAAFGGEVHDVVTAGDFITRGTSVRVVSVDGMRVVVEPDAS